MELFEEGGRRVQTSEVLFRKVRMEALRGLRANVEWQSEERSLGAGFNLGLHGAQPDASSLKRLSVLPDEEDLSRHAMNTASDSYSPAFRASSPLLAACRYRLIECRSEITVAESSPTELLWNPQRCRIANGRCTKRCACASSRRALWCSLKAPCRPMENCSHECTSRA